MIWNILSLLSSLIGSILLAINVFESQLSRQDKAMSFWGSNPFIQTTINYFGIIGVLFLITSFTMNFVVLNILPHNYTLLQTLFVTTVILLSICIITSVLYIVTKKYEIYREKKFSSFILDDINKYKEGKINASNLANSISNHSRFFQKKTLTILIDLYRQQNNKEEFDKKVNEFRLILSQ